MVILQNEVIGTYVFTIFCVDMSNIFVETKMADEFHAEALRGLYCVCGVFIFLNGHVVSSRVGDMSRTFNHLFDMINMPTQISHTCLRAGETFLGKRGARNTISTAKIPLMWIPHSNNVKHANVITPGNR